MAKKRRKPHLAKRLKGFGVWRPLLKYSMQAARTPAGRILIAEALVFATGALVRRPPAVVADAGETAATATRTAGASMSDAAVGFMHAAADRLRAGSGLDVGARHEARGDHKRRSSGSERSDASNGPNGRVWDDLDRDTIRQALLGEFSRKKKSKKGKAAKRH